MSDGTAGAATASEDWVIILKYGFLLSVSDGGDVTTAGGGRTVAGAAAGGGLGFGSGSCWLIWLLPRVGVDASGVICFAPSSSDEELSSSIDSSWRCSSSSRCFAASISARLTAILASCSFASTSAAFFFLFSSSFRNFPC